MYRLLLPPHDATNQMIKIKQTTRTICAAMFKRGRNCKDQTKKLSARSTLDLIRTLLTLRCPLPPELRLDEDVDVAVHHFLHVARLGAGAVVFDHLIRLKDVGTNLVAPGDLAFLAVLPVDLGAFFVLLDLIKFRF